MLISKRTVLTILVVSLLGTLSRSSVSALTKLLACFCPCLDFCSCRNVRTENLSLHILHYINKDCRFVKR